MDDDSSKEDVPPPIEATGDQVEETVEKIADGAEKTAGSIPLEAPSIAGISLAQGTMRESDERTMSLLAHILGGVTCVLGPLIIWLIKKDESPFVDDQGKEATNFQITVLIAYFAAMILSFVPIIQCIAALLFPAIGVASLIFSILGGIEANKGVVYRYPFAVRLIA